MKFRNALLMLVLLSASLAYLALDDVNDLLPSSENAKKDDEMLILRGVASDSIDNIQFNSPKGNFALEKVEESGDANRRVWRLRDAPQLALDPDVLIRILDQITNLRALNFITAADADPDLANYGLHNPSLSVRVMNKTAQQPVELRFGDRHKLSGRRYLRLANQDGVYVVDESVYAQLLLRPVDVREKRPLRALNLETLDGITIRRKNGSLVFTNNRNSGNWSVHEETAGDLGVLRMIEADRSTLDELIKNLRALVAVEFIDEPAAELAAFGLDRPIVSILFKLPQGKSVIVNIGEVRSEGKQENGLLPKRSYFFQVNGRFPIYRTEKRFFSDYLQGAHFFRDRQPLHSLNLQTISKFSLGSQTNEPIVIMRESGKESWKMQRGGKLEEIDRGVVNKFLTAIQQLKVLSYVEDNTTLGGAMDGSSGPELFLSFEGKDLLGGLTVYGAVGEIGTSGTSPSATDVASDAPRLAAIRFGTSPAIRLILSAEQFKLVESLRAEMLEE